MIRRRILPLVIISILFLLSTLQGNIVTAIDISAELNTGPYVDRVVYIVIPGQDERILAIQAGDIQIDYSFFDPVHYATLEADPEIDIYTATRNGYGCITINCRDAPLNETTLRRAFAFAFDKTRVTAEPLDGWSREHDSVVPYPNGWCIEDELPWHYYTAQPEIGNALLNTSGLFPYGLDGWRTYKGQPMDPIEIEYFADVLCCYGSAIPRIGVDALLSLDIPAVVKPAHYVELTSRLNQHGAFDMAIFGYSFYGNDITQLVDMCYSANTDREGLNPSNFRNATFDSCLPQFLSGATYEEVYNASKWMQLILHEQVPLLVTYDNTYNQAYRIDKFTGHVPDFGQYISGPWTTRNVHLIEGSTPTDFATGGTLTISIQHDPDSFNIYTSNSASTHAILNEVLPSLYVYDPEGRPWPFIAKELITETHVDNPEVPVGHTRFTIDIIQNATWSDGVPLTANDVAFTFTYLIESGLAGNQIDSSLGFLEAANAPTPYRVVFEFNSESYWDFNSFAFQYIIPQHIFNNETGIGFGGWDDWNPVFNPEDSLVTAGPFILTDFERGEFYELTYNPDFAYGVNRPQESWSPPPPPPPPTPLLRYIIGVSMGVSFILLAQPLYNRIVRYAQEKGPQKAKETSESVPLV
ncbi:MAG: ABC transporter substrate-binding protein [Candidatus Thorarchaeota archaeon]